MTETTKRKPSPILKGGAIYISDNGRLICAKCAGTSALYTGRDISGQQVERLAVEDVAYFEDATRKPVTCEAGCTSVSRLSGSDGWPAVRESTKDGFTVTFAPTTQQQRVRSEQKKASRKSSLLQQVGRLQSIQKRNHPDSDKWRQASVELAPLFRSMAELEPCEASA